MTKTQKGFTLIELLVVIAIIGILAGILFVAINPKAQTDKANNAAQLSNLAQIRTQAALVFSASTDGSYVGTCAKAIAGKLAVNGHCAETATEWAADVDTTNATGATVVKCADSTGFTGDPVNYTAGTSTKCVN